jgi:cytochrome b subunit of formate dehydrogenase
MKKSETLFILAVVLTLLGLIEGITGFILWFAIPEGGGGRGVEKVFWTLSKNTWIDIHDWAAVALLALVIIHIILHWRWVVHMFKTCCPYLRGRSRKNG